MVMYSYLPASFTNRSLLSETYGVVHQITIAIDNTKKDSLNHGRLLQGSIFIVAIHISHYYIH